MNKEEKLVMILEKTGSSVSVVNKEDEGYVLEGVFAQFGVLNNNKRIYEEKEYLPHLEYLKEKISKNALFGELDHPKEFDVSLKNVSHVIESLEYDKENRQIKGRIRLVNTDAGKNAKALVDAGLQMSISSRAAGIVKENNKVEIKKIFTYDLVAEPGFSNAQLNKINESLGFSSSDDNLAIYDMSNIYENKLDVFEKPINNEKNEKSLMEGNNYVTIQMLDKYTQHIKEQYDVLLENFQKIKTGDTTNINTNDIKKDISNINEYIEYFSNNYGKLLEYQEYMVNDVNESRESVNEKLNNMVDYFDHIQETVSGMEQYFDHIHENVSNITDYLDYQHPIIKESVENVDLLIKHNNYLVENMKGLINYTESLAENIDTLHKHNNYLTENINNLISYVEYIKDNVNENNSKSKSEDKLTESLNESTTYVEENLSSKIDSLIESVKKQKAEEVASKANFPYFKLLSESKQREFLVLPENQKQKIISEVIKAKPMNESDFVSIWAETVNPIDESKHTEYVISLMPENYKAIWESLDESSKNRILAQSKYYNLSTPYQIKSFWETRPILNEAVEFKRLNENEVYSDKVKNTYGSDYMNKIAMGMRRFK